VLPVRVTFGIGVTKRKIHIKMLSGFFFFGGGGVRAVSGFYTNLVFLRCGYKIQNLFSNIE